MDVKYSLAVYATLEEEDNYMCENNVRIIHPDLELHFHLQFCSIYIKFITINNYQNREAIYIVKLNF